MNKFVPSEIRTAKKQAHSDMFWQIRKEREESFMDLIGNAIVAHSATSELPLKTTVNLFELLWCQKWFEQVTMENLLSDDVKAWFRKVVVPDVQKELAERLKWLIVSRWKTELEVNLGSENGRPLEILEVLDTDQD